MKKILLSVMFASTAVFGMVSENKLENQPSRKFVNIESSKQSEQKKEFWKILTKKSFNAKKLKKFLNTGIDINCRNNQGDTPFLYAVRTHKNRLLEFLLKIPEVNVSAVDPNGNTSVIIAAKYKNIDLVKKLASHIDYDKSDVLNFLYAYKNQQKWNDEQIQKCIDKGIRNFLDMQNNKGNTALMTAISYGNYTLIRYLVERGVDVKKSNIFGLTPMVSAIEKANRKSVKCLIECNSDINFSAEEEATFLTLAKEKGLKKITQILEKAKAVTYFR